MTILKRDYNITVTESRGRWSYLPENRQRPITWRRLGDDYSKEAIEECILRRIRDQQEQEVQLLLAPSRGCVVTCERLCYRRGCCAAHG